MLTDLQLINLPIGTKLYYLKSTHNGLTREKVKKVDEDGIEWFRYNKPIQTFEIETFEIVGKIICRPEGEISPTYILEHMIFAKNVETGIILDFEVYVNIPDNGGFSQFCVSLEEAEMLMKNLEEQNKER